ECLGEPLLTKLTRRWLPPHVRTTQAVVSELGIDFGRDGRLRLERKRLFHRRAETLSVIPQRVNSRSLLKDLDLALDLRLELQPSGEERERVLEDVFALGLERRARPTPHEVPLLQRAEVGLCPAE